LSAPPLQKAPLAPLILAALVGLLLGAAQEHENTP
jgi:hypothetical protein